MVGWGCRTEGGERRRRRRGRGGFSEFAWVVRVKNYHQFSSEGPSNPVLRVKSKSEHELQHCWFFNKCGA